MKPIKLSYNFLAFYPFNNEERLHKSRELRSLIHGYITLRF